LDRRLLVRRCVGEYDYDALTNIHNLGTFGGSFEQGCILDAGRDKGLLVRHPDRGASVEGSANCFTTRQLVRADCLFKRGGIDHRIDHLRQSFGLDAGSFCEKVTPQTNPICPSNGFTDAFGKIRARPATVGGLVAGYVAGLAQELAGGPAVHVGVGNNAIQFTGLIGGDPVGFTLGNVQLYGANTGPASGRGRYDGGAATGNMGNHEEGHTYQFQSSRAESDHSGSYPVAVK
jgi:hypothetical protein